MRLEFGTLPNRKRKALWIVDGGSLIVIAYFVSDDAAAKFASMSPQFDAALMDENDWDAYGEEE